MFRSSILILLLIFVGGCTTVSITSMAGTKIERSFGFARVSLSSKEGPMLVEINALGFISGPMGYAVGFSRQQLAVIPDTCRVIFWIKSEAEAKVLQSLISGREEFCSLVSNQKEGNK